MSAVGVVEELTEWFKITVGASQGCGLSSDLFNLLPNAVIRLALNSVNAGVIQIGEILNNMHLADDIDLVAESPHQLQELTGNGLSSAMFRKLSRMWKTISTQAKKNRNKTVQGICYFSSGVRI